MQCENHCVYGLLVKIEESDLATIRKKEGFPNSYGEICVTVEKFDGTKVQNVKTHKVIKCKEKPEHQPPTKHYRQLIIDNAGKYCFPGEYIGYLESIPIKESNSSFSSG